MKNVYRRLGFLIKALLWLTALAAVRRLWADLADIVRCWRDDSPIDYRKGPISSVRVGWQLHVQYQQVTFLAWLALGKLRLSTSVVLKPFRPRPRQMTFVVFDGPDNRPDAAQANGKGYMSDNAHYAWATLEEQAV